jgi:hypothetical protein
VNLGLFIAGGRCRKILDLPSEKCINSLTIWTAIALLRAGGQLVLPP